MVSVSEAARDLVRVLRDCESLPVAVSNAIGDQRFGVLRNYIAHQDAIARVFNALDELDAALIRKGMKP